MDVLAVQGFTEGLAEADGIETIGIRLRPNGEEWITRRRMSNVSWMIWGSAVGLATAVAVEMYRRQRGDTLMGPLGPFLFGAVAIVAGAIAIFGLLVAMTPRNERDLARKLMCFVVSILIGFATSYSCILITRRFLEPRG